MKNKVKKIVKDLLWMDTKNLENITLSKLEKQMKEEKFDINFINDIIQVLTERYVELGEEEFKKWIYNLNFQCPEDFRKEIVAKQIYEKNKYWIEKELVKLEKETEVSWEVQSEDLKYLDIKARKAQLVIRHRLSEIVLELI